MKKLISFILFFAVSTLLFADFSELKVGDTFEYKIEQIITSSQFEIIAVEIQPGTIRDERTGKVAKFNERQIVADLSFTVSKIHADTSIVNAKVFNISIKGKDKNANEDVWHNFLDYNSKLGTPSQQIIALFPLLTEKEFTIKVTSEKILFEINQFYSKKEKDLLEKIFLNPRLNANSSTFHTSDSLHFNLMNNIQEISKIDFAPISVSDSMTSSFWNYNLAKFSIEYTFEDNEYLPQLFQKKTFQKSENNIETREFIEIKRIVHYPTFKTKYYPDISLLQNPRDTIIFRPNAKLSGLLKPNATVKIQIKSPNYFQNRYLVYELICDENGRFEFYLNIEQPVELSVDWKKYGIVCPGDLLTIDSYEEDFNDNSAFYNKLQSYFANERDTFNNSITINNFLDSTKYLIPPTVWQQCFFDYKFLKFKNISFENKQEKRDSFNQCFQINDPTMASSEIFTWDVLEDLAFLNESMLNHLLGTANCLLQYYLIQKNWEEEKNHDKVMYRFENFMQEYNRSEIGTQLQKFADGYKHLKKGSKVPSLSIKDFVDNTYSINGYKGKVVYILFYKSIYDNFYNDFRAFYSRLKDKDVTIFTVRTTPQDPCLYTSNHLNNFEWIDTYIDPTTNKFEYFNKFLKMEHLPRAIILDKNGNLFNYHAPDISMPYEAEKEIEEALKVPTPTKALLNKLGIFIPIIAVILLVIFMSYYIRKTRKIKFNKQLNEVKLKAIRSQMNPHFIFNALNSIQGLVNTNKKEEANIYLSKFATLLRNVLENSESTFISIEEELEAVSTYCELEKMRIDFDWEFEIDPAIKTNEVEISGMLIQPLIENAIVHGLAPKSDNRKLKLTINQKENNLIVAVADNGVGIVPGQLDKLREKGFGLKLVEERVQLLRMEKKKVHFEILPYGINKEQGTTVKLVFPIY